MRPAPRAAATPRAGAPISTPRAAASPRDLPPTPRRRPPSGGRATPGTPQSAKVPAVESAAYYESVGAVAEAPKPSAVAAVGPPPPKPKARPPPIWTGADSPEDAPAARCEVVVACPSTVAP